MNTNITSSPITIVKVTVKDTEEIISLKVCWDNRPPKQIYLEELI
ncbi:hypothetical protein SAMN05877753_102535 [Bacillus oleivorans]|uniref:Uncharacterized protein n=1 Tax=Bacillus oleivorans TaxID=1448271 RepID=A0A285CLN5_9BACI|nr:hypothetical protein [Bacillus oleivorans]SNX68447.1 hypothetical protein SAMN05877753_102535 [Bacillus oleivorans]